MRVEKEGGEKKRLARMERCRTRAICVRHLRVEEEGLYESKDAEIKVYVRVLSPTVSEQKEKRNL
jgi:hypothetical protein